MIKLSIPGKDNWWTLRPPTPKFDFRGFWEHCRYHHGVRYPCPHWDPSEAHSSPRDAFLSRPIYCFLFTGWRKPRTSLQPEGTSLPHGQGPQEPRAGAGEGRGGWRVAITWDTHQGGSLNPASFAPKAAPCKEINQGCPWMASRTKDNWFHSWFSESTVRLVVPTLIARSWLQLLVGVYPVSDSFQ